MGRLNATDDVPEAARTPLGANVTELNVVDISSAELQAAGCKWLWTSGSGWHWACWGGGRRLNATDDVPEAARTPLGANVTELNVVDISSAELQAAGCEWLWTSGSGWHW